MCIRDRFHCLKWFVWVLFKIKFDCTNRETNGVIKSHGPEVHLLTTKFRANRIYLFKYMYISNLQLSKKTIDKFFFQKIYSPPKKGKMPLSGLLLPEPVGTAISICCNIRTSYAWSRVRSTRGSVSVVFWKARQLVSFKFYITYFI